MPNVLDHLQPGSRVRIVHLIQRRSGSWRTTVEGEVLEILDAPTGSWFAHGQGGHYWLRRLRIRKTDGEITVVSVAPESEITVIHESDPSSSVKSETA
ncbi:MAG: hypothetical protein GXP29_08030 [Planctomycetes bacterium]|nr:hypothetical protein [Planctomycetota bacterium]